MVGARFLLAVIDGGGTVPPALGVAAALVERGHDVRVLADPTIARSARAAGCAFTPWTTAPHFNSTGDQTAAISQMEGRNPYRRYTAFKYLFSETSSQGFAEDLLSAVRQHPVDAVLAEAAIPGVLIGAEAAGLPTAALMPNIYIRPAPGLPMFGTGWSPARGAFGRARDSLAGAGLRRLTGSIVAPLNAVRASHGLSPVDELYELLDQCARVLVLTSPTFDFPATRLPPNVRYVGPQLDDPDWALTEDWRPEGSGPLVLVAMSSVFQNQVDVLRRIAAALGRLPVRAVLTTGRAIDRQIMTTPGNVRILRFAPHREVLSEASLVVTHAGHGTVLKALAAGVPLVCAPMGRDQRDNTVRVLRLGAGVRISKRAKPDQIADAVRQVLEGPGYADAARRVAQILAMEAATRPSAADEAEALPTSLV